MKRLFRRRTGSQRAAVTMCDRLALPAPITSSYARRMDVAQLALERARSSSTARQHKACRRRRRATLQRIRHFVRIRGRGRALAARAAVPAERCARAAAHALRGPTAAVALRRGQRAPSLRLSASAMRKGEGAPPAASESFVKRKVYGIN